MSSTAQEEYDRVLYPGTAHAQTHPDRLATLATLFGMRPAPIERCRVLEIGCTDGGNLIPMAYGLPNAQFVGIDVSTRSLAVGRECVDALGLKNIRLLALDLLDFPADFGAFDYIIAHGIYSWVPLVVREKILAICRAHLAPQGVAYISYNAHPGSHFRELVRGMMLYHVHAIPDPEERRSQAIALVRFLIDAQPEKNLIQQVLSAELERIEDFTPAVFYHDDLAETRTPLYFHEFIAQAAGHSLQYLSEAAIYEMQEQSFGPKVVEALHAFTGDRIGREQYLDFLKCRRFRQTLLCHGEVAVEGPRPDAVRALLISSQAKPVSAAPVLDESVVEEFAVPTSVGARLKTANSLAKAVVLQLADLWPQCATFDALVTAARARLGEKGAAFASDHAASELAEALLAMYAAGLIEFHVHPARFTLELSERPIVSSIARWSLAKGASEVTNLRHRTVRADDSIGAQLMLLLDGTRDRGSLIRDLATFCQSGGLIRQPDGAVVSDLARLQKVMEAGLEENLRKLARRALLVG